MKILIISREFPPHVVGGAGYHSYYLSKALLKLGHKVKVVSAVNCSTRQECELSGKNSFDIKRFGYFNKLMPRYWFNIKILKELKKEKLRDFDVLISHEYIDFNRINFPGKKILKIHYNLSEKHKEFENQPIRHFMANNFLWPLERNLEQRALLSADGIIFNSKLSKKRYMKKLPLLKNKEQAVIYNGIDVNRFSINNKVKREDYFLFVGGDSVRKGFENILKMAQLLPAGFKILVVGKVSEKNKALMSKKKNIEPIGRIKQGELINYYQRAQALIHPCFYEPFGNVVLESLSCGTPVIVSNEKHCGAAELINNRVGIKIDPNNISRFLFFNFFKKTFDKDKMRKIVFINTWEINAKKTIDFLEKI